MYFQILGEITRAETFAVGSGIREIARLRNSTEKDVGESARVMPVFALMTVRSFWPKFIGMKPRALENVNSR